MGEWYVKYDSECAVCGTALAKGTPAVYDRPSRSIRCTSCPIPERPPTGIDRGVAGRSARMEYARREAKRDAAITERQALVRRDVVRIVGAVQAVRVVFLDAVVDVQESETLDVALVLVEMEVDVHIFERVRVALEQECVRIHRRHRRDDR